MMHPKRRLPVKARRTKVVPRREIRRPLDEGSHAYCVEERRSAMTRHMFEGAANGQHREGNILWSTTIGYLSNP